MNTFNPVKKKNRYKNILYLLVSFLIAFQLASLDNILFKDRYNYLTYLNSMELRLELIIKGGIIFFEPLFYAFNSFLLLLLIPENVLFLWIFIVCFSLVYFSFRVTKNIFAAVLLFLIIFLQPQSFAILLVTTRQGIGVAILIWSLFFIKKEKHFVYSIIIAGLIHNSFLIIAFLYMIGYYLDIKEYKYYNKYYFIGLLSLAVNLAFFSLIRYFNVKESYLDFDSEARGGAFLLWLIVLIYMLFFKKRCLNSKFLFVRIAYNFSVIGLLIYLTSYFLSPIAGRIIGTFIPFIYFILLYNMRIVDLFFVIALLVLNVYLFFNGGAEGFLAVPLNVFFENMKF